MKKAFDIISIGDPTIDTFLHIHDAVVTCKLDHAECKIAFDYAEKIPVDKLETRVAGNACNNAVGSSRLGLKTAYYMVVGNDTAGRRIADALKKEKVSSDYFTTDKKNETNASNVMVFQGERTIFVYHAPRKYKLPKLKKSEWIYYSSVNKGHQSLDTAIINHVKKHKVKLGYNPGTYQRLAGPKQMQRVASNCEVVFVNLEEAQDLVVSKSRNVKTLLKKMHHLGTRIAVITDGANGSYTFDGESMYHAGVPNTPVIERTGAGDAYATTFIAMLAQDRTIAEAMCLATSNSSNVIMHVGPQTGLLTTPKLLRFHKKNPHGCTVATKI